jgi:hypothetical protein
MKSTLGDLLIKTSKTLTSDQKGWGFESLQPRWLWSLRKSDL